MQNPALGAAAVDGLSVTIAGTIRSNRQPNTPKLVASIVFIQVGTISPGLLQYLALLFPTAACNASSSWLTPSVPPPQSSPLPTSCVSARQNFSSISPAPIPWRKSTSSGQTPRECSSSDSPHDVISNRKFNTIESE